MPHFRFAMAALLAAIAVLGASCGSSSDARDDDLVVVASFYPLAEAAQRVGNDLVTVENLTPPGVEPHDLELAPDDLEAIVTADVVLYIGGGFQPAVQEGIADAEGIVLDVLDVAGSLRSPPPGEQEGDEDVPADPHVWLDPTRYGGIVEAVAETLARVQPAQAAMFRAGAEAFGSELSALDREFAEDLATCRSRTIVVNHAAFGYLAGAYDLEQLSISGISPEAEVDPARLAELTSLVEREGVTTIFTEELASPEVAETLAEEAGVQTAVLNPLEGLTPEQLEAGEDYRSVMRQNLDALRRGLGCS
ncbi:MAG: metal ABC transporter substrate-binding protein [Actinomycetota bacterium]